MAVNIHFLIKIINLIIDIFNTLIDDINIRFQTEGVDGMQRHVPTTCPSCSETMHITEFTCPRCSTRVQGDFPASGLLRLKQEQLEFVEVFLRCRGNIKEVERDLKISYPTVRSKLDHVIRSLGYEVATEDRLERETEALLNGLQSGELTFHQAMEMLREGKEA
jgi:hypothetical protein